MKKQLKKLSVSQSWPLIKILVLGLLLQVQSPAAHALHLEGFGSFGLGTAEIDGESESPNMGFITVGGTVGLNIIPMLYLGGTVSLYRTNQYSSPDKDHGQRRGSRLNYFAPTVGLNLPLVQLKYELHMMGDYKLSKKDSSDREITYKSPLGHRLTAYTSLFPLFDIGVYFEMTEFDKEEVGSTESDLTNKFKLQHAGVVVALTF